MENVLCEICGVDDSNPYKSENRQQAVQCRRCGLVYCNPRPSIAEMKQLYDGQETKVNVRAHLQRRDHKTIEARACLDLIQQYRSSGRVLEIGSAAGYFLSEAKKRGFTVQGLDLTRQFVEFSQRVLDVPAYEGTLQSAPFAPQSFDLVYLRNVMSHLAYPRDELVTMGGLLVPGGHLILETGNVAELSAAEAGELELPDHLYHFSEANLRSLLETAGFRWLATHRYVLADQLATVRKVSSLFSSSGAAKPRPEPTPISDSELATLPASRWLDRMAAHVVTAGRYKLGSMLPKTGRRCSLVMIAERIVRTTSIAAKPVPRREQVTVDDAVIPG
jgi:2-polyprenyl-3-methyl-5-hydroxy-6-metoxy-1,4-benzoquinol methylase